MPDNIGESAKTPHSGGSLPIITSREMRESKARSQRWIRSRALKERRSTTFLTGNESRTWASRTVGWKVYTRTNPTAIREGQAKIEGARILWEGPEKTLWLTKLDVYLSGTIRSESHYWKLGRAATLILIQSFEAAFLPLFANTLSCYPLFLIISLNWNMIQINIRWFIASLIRSAKSATHQVMSQELATQIGLT